MQKCEQFHFRHRYNDAKIETIPLDGQGFHGRDLNLSDVHGALSVGGFTEKFEINVD